MRRGEVYVGNMSDDGRGEVYVGNRVMRICHEKG